MFDLPTKFQKGVDDKVKATVKAITPLPTPLSQKKLVFAMPRQSAFIKESAKRFAAVHGAPPVKLAKKLWRIFLFPISRASRCFSGDQEEEYLRFGRVC